MKRTLLCLLPVGLLLAGAAAPEFSVERYIAHIKFLASPEMKGRASGSPELEKAAQYIAGQYRAAGVKPPARHDYLQAFEVTTSARLGRGNHFDFVTGGRTRNLTMSEEFVPFNFSSSGKASGAVVFAGY